METTKRVWSHEQLPIFEEFKNGRSHFVAEARAGTGKTTTILHGIGLAPEKKKAYLAFNKKNVVEARAKITDPNTQVLSLNGLGHRFVNAMWKGVTPDDDVEFDRIKAAISANADAAMLHYPPLGLIRDIVAFAKNTQPFAKYPQLLAMAEARGILPEDNQEARGWRLEVLCQLAADAMERAKKPDSKNRISFNDQLWLPVVMNWARPWFELVVVDECQDMNATQLLLAKKACKPSGRIVLVGDPRQAIYGFRGADVNGMERLKKELNAKTFPLTITYRCATAIVDLAKKLVPDYKAAPTAPEGVISYLPINKIEIEARPGNAIISRANAPLMTLCLSFLKKGIRAYIEGRDVGASLLSVHEKLLPVADTIRAYIEAADTWAADRISKTVGEPESDTYKSAIQGIMDRADTLKALAEECKAPREVGSRLLSLFDDSDKSSRGPSIVLSSVHKAKGLEWDKVFLVTETFKTNWTPDVSENNNIAYVAVTRAKSELVWLTPETTHESGKSGGVEGAVS